MAISSSRFSPLMEEAWSLCVIEFRDLLFDQIQSLYCPAIIILVVAHDEPLRHSTDGAGSQPIGLIA